MHFEITATKFYGPRDPDNRRDTRIITLTKAEIAKACKEAAEEKFRRAYDYNVSDHMSTTAL